ncbi:prepilin peptidase [Caldanaerobacter subterraneus]|uniref:Prepilin type IV endopeptidase peptidase domain-containing protein n=1 Tax=Caldanaerobacter subterraneus TaxID=911092 RepID=A0A7Y2PM99_9THEO|nr:prepilin peptidase [Caldanaerobacter subterraneus]NNG66431.1 hypothetical protein [Caldanaerobacter subterraneus]
MNYFIIFLMGALLIYLSYIDLREKRIPNMIIGPAYIASTFYNLYLFFNSRENIVYSNFLGFLFAIGLMLLIGIISKGGIGGGDIKLYGLLGLTFGFQTVLKIIVFSTIWGGFFSILLVLLKKKKLKDSLPFAPFIMLGFLTAVFTRL